MVSLWYLNGILMVFIWYLLTTKNELFLEFQASYFSTLKKLKKTKSSLISHFFDFSFFFLHYI